MTVASSVTWSLPHILICMLGLDSLTCRSRISPPPQDPKMFGNPITRLCFRSCSGATWHPRCHHLLHGSPIGLLAADRGSKSNQAHYVERFYRVITASLFVVSCLRAIVVQSTQEMNRTAGFYNVGRSRTIFKLF